MDQVFELSGKTAIVTGGASGIGAGISKLFAQRGAHVSILDINDSDASNLTNELNESGLSSSYHKCDITNQNSVFEIVNQIHSDHQSVDVLVNNAGIAFIGNIEQTTEADLDRLYNVNIKGAYNCSLAAIKKMKEKGGSIINIVSIAATLGIADRFAYSMTKGALLTMTYSIAKDYIAHGIRCNAISPARVHTPFVDGFLKENYPGQEKVMFDKLSKTQPIGRMGTPEEIANLALYLSSDEASFVTGSNFNIDGGFTTLNS